MSELRFPQTVRAVIESNVPDTTTRARIEERLRNALSFAPVWEREPLWETHTYIDAWEDELFQDALNVLPEDRRDALAQGIIETLETRPSSVIQVDAAEIVLSDVVRSSATVRNLTLGGALAAPEPQGALTGQQHRFMVEAMTAAALRAWADARFERQDDWFRATFPSDDPRARICTLTFRARHVGIHDAIRRLDKFGTALLAAPESLLRRAVGGRARPADAVAERVAKQVVKHWITTQESRESREAPWARLGHAVRTHQFACDAVAAGVRSAMGDAR